MEISYLQTVWMSLSVSHNLVEFKKEKKVRNFPNTMNSRWKFLNFVPGLGQLWSLQLPRSRLHIQDRVWRVGSLRRAKLPGQTCLPPAERVHQQRSRGWRRASIQTLVWTFRVSSSYQRHPLQVNKHQQDFLHLLLLKSRKSSLLAGFWWNLLPRMYNLYLPS